MPGKTLEIISGSVGPEIVEEEEGVVQFRLMKAEGSAQMDACPLDRGDTDGGVGNCTYLDHNLTSFYPIK